MVVVREKLESLIYSEDKVDNLIYIETFMNKEKIVYNIVYVIPTI